MGLCFLLVFVECLLVGFGLFFVLADCCVGQMLWLVWLLVVDFFYLDFVIVMVFACCFTGLPLIC